ncbi:HAD-IA family hydrolase [Corynebacterium breve]|uniref:HAD-IA family hydrolase n=1 Tax=Corynebacterium breve TaxID=3049799 RepID=A0ABY8VD49_9CORY|nr:HAD-IA family hydrolase [Corynebacterium breve]WIM67037.1 HAD-IA family hydrolase [Corynebacterium breve]
MTVLLVDVDGTLIDSFPGIRAGFLHALDSVGWPHPSDDVVSRIAGPPMETTLSSLGMADDTVREAFEAYMSFTRDGGWADASAFPGIRNLLAAWHNDGFRMVTATSKGEGFARAILEREGLMEYFEFLGAAEEYGTRRTKEAVIQYVFDNVDLDNEKILMIGDRHHDIDGAAAFGVPTAIVTWGYGTQPEWDDADFVARTLQELDQIVRNF